MLSIGGTLGDSSLPAEPEKDLKFAFILRFRRMIGLNEEKQN